MNDPHYKLNQDDYEKINHQYKTWLLSKGYHRFTGSHLGTTAYMKRVTHSGTPLRKAPYPVDGAYVVNIQTWRGGSIAIELQEIVRTSYVAPISNRRIKKTIRRFQLPVESYLEYDKRIQAKKKDFHGTIKRWQQVTLDAESALEEVIRDKVKIDLDDFDI